MREFESASIHVRRGDCLREQHASKLHGICIIDYYERAIRDLRERKDDFY
jgi:hypothetical protein